MRSDAARLPSRQRALALCLAVSFGCVPPDGWSARTAVAQQAAGDAGAAAAPSPRPAGEELLTQPQLEQLLAPIALYPDALLAQTLMAATYPLELVQAQRWLARDRNASLKGDALAQALQSQPWDASVKSLVPFPDVLKMMSDQLEWVQQLGDAVLAQQQDVFNAVQVLRARAQEAGKLQSGPQQTVNVTKDVGLAPATGGVAQSSGAPAGGVNDGTVTQVVAPPP